MGVSSLQLDHPLRRLSLAVSHLFSARALAVRPRDQALSDTRPSDLDVLEDLGLVSWTDFARENGLDDRAD